MNEMKSLKPDIVIAGHENPKNDDGSRVIGETRQYILDFQEFAGKTISARELHYQMLVECVAHNEHYLFRCGARLEACDT